MVPLARNVCGHSLAGLVWERQFEEVLVEHGWEEVPKYGRSSETRCIFVSVCGLHLWKKLMNNVDLEELGTNWTT